MNGGRIPVEGEKFWMVWNQAGHMPRVQHDTAEAADREAQRLARLYPGQQIIVLESMRSVKVPLPPVVVIEHSEIPF